MAMLNVGLRFVANNYLPQQLTPTTINFLHSRLPLPISTTFLNIFPFFKPLASPPPAPGSPAFMYRIRMTYAILSMVVFMLSMMSFTPPPPVEQNAYEVLGVWPGADNGLLKSAFRSWAKKHHPDRAGGEDELFRKGRQGYEILKDSIKRFAYERWVD